MTGPLHDRAASFGVPQGSMLREPYDPLSPHGGIERGWSVAPSRGRCAVQTCPPGERAGSDVGLLDTQAHSLRAHGQPLDKP